MIWISVLLVSMRKSFSDFVKGSSICYQIAGLQNKKFEMVYSNDVKFTPENLRMNAYAVSALRKHEKIYEQEMNYTISKYDDGCPGSRLEAIDLTHKSGYKSYFFVAFYFGEFLVEHLTIRMVDVSNENIEGVMGRATLEIGARAQENLDRPSSHPDIADAKLGLITDNIKAYVLKFMIKKSTGTAYILPVQNREIAFPKVAIVKLTLVDTEGSAIAGIPPIMDLIEIRIDSKPNSPSKFYYTTDLRTYNVEIKILSVDGKEIATSKYSLSHISKKFDESFSTGSTFRLFGFQLTELKLTESFPAEITEESFRFMRTQPTTKECKIRGKKAYYTKHVCNNFEERSESQCMAKTRTGLMVYQRQCTSAETAECLKNAK